MPGGLLGAWVGGLAGALVIVGAGAGVLSSMPRNEIKYEPIRSA